MSILLRVGKADRAATLLAVALRFAFGALSVLIPGAVVGGVVFGEFAWLLSITLILTYFIDAGLSIYCQTIRRDAESALIEVRRLIILRDATWMFAVLLGWILIRDFHVAFLVISCGILGAHITGFQSHARATGRPYWELCVNLILVLALALVPLMPVIQEGNSTLLDAYTLFAAVPRVLALIVVLIFRWGFSSREDANRLSARNEASKVGNAVGITGPRRLLPYAAQGILATATTNLDVIIAALVMSPTDVGRIKITTTLMGSCVALMEMFATIKLNEIVNAVAPKRAMKDFVRRSRFIAVGVGFACILLAVPVFHLSGTATVEYWVQVVVGLVVALRIFSLGLATQLTLCKRQKQRVVVMIIINVIYWSGVYILGAGYGYGGFIAATLMAAAVQSAIYYGCSRNIEAR